MLFVGERVSLRQPRIFKDAASQVRPFCNLQCSHAARLRLHFFPYFISTSSSIFSIILAL